MKILFEEWETLASCGPIDQLEDKEVEGTLLVGVKPIGEWKKDHSQFGHNNVDIFPAYHNGEKVFVVRETWQPDYDQGYCAQGTDEYIMSFEEGVKLLLEHGAYRHLFPGLE